jgi:hypothetical protein
VSGLAAVAWIAGAMLLTWAITMARAGARIASLRAELTRLHQEMQREVQYWQADSARARAVAAQTERDAATWAAAWKQGRDDMVSTVPLLVAAHEQLAGLRLTASEGADEL